MSTTSALVTVLIVMACLWAMTLAVLLSIVRLRNRSSIRRSPTPPTTPTPTSGDLAQSMIATMERAMNDTTRQMREMALDLTQGRESQQATGSPETLPTLNGKLIEYDYDSTPLSPGIEAVLEREQTETEQARLLREREELQRLLIEKQTELDRSGLESSSAGPWNQESEEQT